LSKNSYATLKKTNAKHELAKTAAAFAVYYDWVEHCD